MKTGLTRGEILRIVNEYIGVDGGYLGDFSYRTLEEFYPVYCELEIDPFDDQYSGTSRERFIQVLESQTPPTQATILRGVLDRFPEDDENPRRKVFRPKMDEFIDRLEACAAVSVPMPQFTSEVVERALRDVEALIQASGPTSAIDRVHTALHGYLKSVCDNLAGEVKVPKDPTLTQLYKLLRTNHPALEPSGPRAGDIDKVLKAFSAVLDALGPLRNMASVAHPNKELLEAPEAMLVINATRTLLHYLDEKLAAVVEPSEEVPFPW